MQERQPEPSDIDEAIQKQIEHLTDTLGLSWDDARRRVGVQSDDTLIVARNESMWAHPSNTRARVAQGAPRNYEPKYDGDTFPVVDTTEISDEQVITNAVGAAMVRASIHAPDNNLTPQELAIRRAREERRGRRW